MVTGMGANRTKPLVKSAHRLFLVVTIPCFGLAYGESLTIVPEVNLSETYSTNMALSTGPSAHGWISDLAPGLHINATGSRIKANLDYRLDSLHYENHSELSHNLNSLMSNAAIEAIDKWLFIDTSANIVQRKQSVFAESAIDATNASANRSETRTIQFSPYIRGQVSDVAAYQMRFNSIDSRSTDASLANTTITQLSGQVKNASSGAAIGWSINGDASKVRNAVIGNLDSAYLSGALTLAVMPQLHLSISDGAENTNSSGAGMQTNTTPGVGLEWSPSPRTQLAAQEEKRFFGTAHDLILNHRTAWTNWRFSDQKDASNLAAILAGSSQGAVMDLMSQLLTSSIPNPAARADAVRARFEQSGANLNQDGVSAVQSSRQTINRTREASVALIGVRNMVTLSITRLDQQAIGNATGATDSFSLSDNIRQQGGNLSWALRVTPLTNISFATGRVQITGLNASNLNSTQSSYTTTLTHSLGPKTVVSLGGRIIKFDSTVNGIAHEYAAVATLTMRF